MSTYYIITQEKFVNISFNNLFQQDHCGISILLWRNLHHPWKHRRNLHCSKQKLSCFIFLVEFITLLLLGDQSADIQCFISDQWKRSGRVHCHRCKYRIYIILKVSVYKCTLCFCKILMGCHQVHSGFLKRRDQRTVQCIILYMNQFMGTDTDFF